MKKFKISMAKPDTSDIVCEYQGEGEIAFAVKPPDMAAITTFRRECVEAYQELGENPSNIQAFDAAYVMRLNLIKMALDIKGITNEHAVMIMSRTGGINGVLVTELADRYGVNDIFFAQDAGGNLEDEIPI